MEEGVKGQAAGSAAIAVVRAAFAAAWRPALDAIGENKELRERMFRIERELTEVENGIRRTTK